MKRIVPIILVLVLLLSACSTADLEKPYRQMTMNEAAQFMQENSGYVLLDVRSPEEYQDGHIPGAVNLPLDQIGGGDYDLLPDRDQTVLIYCRSGRRSKQAADMLYEQGYRNLIEIGGIKDWTGPIEK